MWFKVATAQGGLVPSESGRVKAESITAALQSGTGSISDSLIKKDQSIAPLVLHCSTKKR